MVSVLYVLRCSKTNFIITSRHRRYLLVCLFGFLTSSSTTRLYRGRVPRQSVWKFYVLPHMSQSWETMTSVSAGHIIPTPTQEVGSRRPQRESNPGFPHQESRVLPAELRPPPPNIPKHINWFIVYDRTLFGHRKIRISTISRLTAWFVIGHIQTNN